MSAGLVVLSTLWLIQAVYGPAKTWVSIVLLRRQRRRFEQQRDVERKRVALIVSAKGITPSFERFMELVTHQHYPDYRLIFVTESDNDPARLAFRRFLGLAEGEDVWRPENGSGLREVRLVVAGMAEDSGQKTFNQCAAFQFLEGGDAIVAFADSDILGDADWLNELSMSLNLQECELTTGYRWLFPETGSLANAVATNINAAVATMNGPSWHTLLWGGSMAMTRSCFDDLQVPELLQGSLNDDLQISSAARSKGKKIIFVRSLLAPSPVNYTWSTLFEFARRQYFQLRIYVPHFWWTVLTLTSIWLVALGWNLWAFARGSVLAGGVIGIVITCDLLRSMLRTSFLHELFAHELVRSLRPARKWEWCTTWLNHLVHWLVMISPVFSREITWAGIHYRVLGRKDVTVLGRRPVRDS